MTTPDLREADLIEALNGIHAYILAGEELATERVLRAAPKLKIVSFFGAGYEKYVDVAAATKLSILVTFTPGANAASVAEFAFGLILNLTRKITYLNTQTRKGKWLEERTWNLKGRTIGIVGLGNVGTKVAEIAKNGFRMRVLYFSRTRNPDKEKALGLEWATNLEKLLTESDIVSLHPPLSDQTIGMIEEKQF